MRVGHVNSPLPGFGRLKYNGTRRPFSVVKQKGVDKFRKNSPTPSIIEPIILTNTI